MEPRRQLQASPPPPEPLRLAISYQHLDSLTTSQQQTLSSVVAAMQRVLAKHLLTARPPSGGLLADPYCLSYSSASSCTLYYPDFVSARPSPDYVTCGLATIQRAHVVDPASCTTKATAAQMAALGTGLAAPASGAGGGASAYGSGCVSYAGTAGEAVHGYLYVTAVQSPDCEAGVAAWAQPCMLDFGDNRPLLGSANVCPSALAGLQPGALVPLLLHEVLHALGFTSSMFGLTIRPDGSRRPLEEVVVTSAVNTTTTTSSTTATGGSGTVTAVTANVSRVVLPGVAAAAAAHFGCPGLGGAALEDEGGEGSAGSHWEYSLFQGDVMVASMPFAADGGPPVLSALTLALLEGTGWYAAAPGAAGRLAWGAGAGCGLAAAAPACGAAGPGVEGLFCDPSADPYALGCSPDFLSLGPCRSTPFTNGCGLRFAPAAARTCMSPSTASPAVTAAFGWADGGAAGRCLPAVGRMAALAPGGGGGTYWYPSGAADGAPTAACLDTSCAPDGATLHLLLHNTTLACPEGAFIDLAAALPQHYVAGRLGPCPPARALCASQSCGGAACDPRGGDCMDGRCYCHLAATGPGCSIDLMAGPAPEGGSSSSSSGSGGSPTPAATAGGGDATQAPPPSVASPPPGNLSAAGNGSAAVVRLQLLLQNHLSEVANRTGSLAAALAAWAGLRPEQVAAAAAAAPAASSPTAWAAANATGTGTGTIAAASASSARGASSSTITSAQAAAAAHGQAGRRLQEASPSPAPSPNVTACAGSDAPTLATALLSLDSGDDLAGLVGRLGGGGGGSGGLGGALAAAGFDLQPGGLTFTVTYPQQATAAPAPPPAAPPSHSAAAASNRSLLILVAAATAAAVAVGIVVGVAVALTARAVRGRREAAAAAAAAQRQYQQQAPPALYGGAAAAAAPLYAAPYGVGGGRGGPAGTVLGQPAPAAGCGAWGPAAGPPPPPHQYHYRPWEQAARAEAGHGYGPPPPPPPPVTAPLYGAYQSSSGLLPQRRG